MPQYFSPGVYVEEVSSGPKPIAGVPTSVAAIVGKARKGPALEPRRVTSFQEYLALFGDYVDDGYMAESVNGFFENGGNAIWVVRADASQAATWNVTDANGRQSFVVDAASPGDWANDLAVRTFWDVGGGSASAYASKVTAASASINSTDPFQLAVESAAGASPGMPVHVYGATTVKRVAKVQSVSANTLTLTLANAPTPAITFTPDDDVWVVARVGPDALSFTKGNGVEKADLLRARAAGETDDQYGVVETVQSTGAGLTGTLVGNGFSDSVDAATFARRTVLLDAALPADPAGRTNPDPGALDYLGQPKPLTDIVRLIGRDGLEAPLGTGQNPKFDTGGVELPPGTVKVEVGVQVSPWQVTLPEQTFQTAAELTEAFKWVPQGVMVELTRTGTSKVQATRSAAGFDLTPASTQFPLAKVTKVAYVFAGDVAVVTATAPPEAGDWLATGNTLADRRRITGVVELAGSPPGVYAVRVAGLTAAPAAGNLLRWQPTRFETVRFGIDVDPPADAAVPPEHFPGLSLDPSHDRYYANDGVINERSKLIEVRERAAAQGQTLTAVSNVKALPARVAPRTAGDTGDVDVKSIESGLAALEKDSEPALVACPDALTLDDDVLTARAVDLMVAHCERMRRFAVVDLPMIDDDQELKRWRLETVNSTYAAAYAPFVKIINPRIGPGQARVIEVPPSGFMMGVYARVDNERGVFKAPANEIVRGIVGPHKEYTQRHQDALNPNAVNLIRTFRGRGTRIWGARNATDDTTWRYVNVRRLFNFVESSVDAGTQWVVFEPNDPNTWLRVRVTVENFLNGVWRSGGLLGAAPEEAYRVRVGLGETMTETDIDLGLLVVEVAIAPVKPAEFVVFRISHKRLSE
ncbi:MAG: phage tail sheath subtilisin-like domain-containing protein [Actinomycetota bacterium]|nr:phage tail sheath subtilisin-like domain-containing protein [Actinomycetota bacterium]